MGIEIHSLIMFGAMQTRTCVHKQNDLGQGRQEHLQHAQTQNCCRHHGKQQSARAAGVVVRQGRRGGCLYFVFRRGRRSSAGQTKRSKTIQIQTNLGNTIVQRFLYIYYFWLILWFFYANHIFIICCLFVDRWSRSPDGVAKEGSRPGSNPPEKKMKQHDEVQN